MPKETKSTLFALMTGTPSRSNMPVRMEVFKSSSTSMDTQSLSIQLTRRRIGNKEELKDKRRCKLSLRKLSRSWFLKSLRLLSQRSKLNQRSNLKRMFKNQLTDMWDVMDVTPSLLSESDTSAVSATISTSVRPVRRRFLTLTHSSRSRPQSKSSELPELSSDNTLTPAPSEDVVDSEEWERCSKRCTKTLKMVKETTWLKSSPLSKKLSLRLPQRSRSNLNRRRSPRKLKSPRELKSPNKRSSSSKSLLLNRRRSNFFAKFLDLSPIKSSKLSSTTTSSLENNLLTSSLIHPLLKSSRSCEHEEYYKINMSKN